MDKKNKDVLSRFADKGVYPHQLSFLLDTPFRRLIISPSYLADNLGLKKDSVVLEIGPGPGYFSIEIAKRIPDGKLELLDIQEEMLDKVRKKAEKRKLTNIRYSVGDASKLPYKDSSFDIIFMVTVLGEISEKEKCLKEMKRVLKKEGMISITEQKGDPDHIKENELIIMFEKAGFKLSEKFKKSGMYTANFKA